MLIILRRLIIKSIKEIQRTVHLWCKFWNVRRTTYKWYDPICIFSYGSFHHCYHYYTRQTSPHIGVLIVMITGRAFIYFCSFSCIIIGLLNNNSLTSVNHHNIYFALSTSIKINYNLYIKRRSGMIMMIANYPQ